jgi:hypothetical protein
MCLQILLSPFANHLLCASVGPVDIPAWPNS